MQILCEYPPLSTSPACRHGIGDRSGDSSLANYGIRKKKKHTHKTAATARHRLCCLCLVKWELIGVVDLSQILNMSQLFEHLGRKGANMVQIKNGQIVFEYYSAYYNLEGANLPPNDPNFLGSHGVRIIALQRVSGD